MTSEFVDIFVQIFNNRVEKFIKCDEKGAEKT